MAPAVGIFAFNHCVRWSAIGTGGLRVFPPAEVKLIFRDAAAGLKVTFSLAWLAGGGGDL